MASKVKRALRSRQNEVWPQSAPTVKRQRLNKNLRKLQPLLDEAEQIERELAELDKRGG